MVSVTTLMALLGIACLCLNYRMALKTVDKIRPLTVRETDYQPSMTVKGWIKLECITTGKIVKEKLVEIIQSSHLLGVDQTDISQKKESANQIVLEQYISKGQPRYYQITQGNFNQVQLQIYQLNATEQEFEELTKCFGILHSRIPNELIFAPYDPFSEKLEDPSSKLQEQSKPVQLAHDEEEAGEDELEEDSSHANTTIDHMIQLDHQSQ